MIDMIASFHGKAVAAPEQPCAGDYSLGIAATVFRQSMIVTGAMPSHAASLWSL
ncbi:MAG TPA: hypothetical protein QF469_22035 [Sphingomonas sanguinis]|uniref:hypothetical protein n=1 Tax=Sphingomonas sanguinis TaxID=33051 RepID=UPI002AC12AA1|nr:hypothetical protein [Sphingomonas sanguinis]